MKRSFFIFTVITCAGFLFSEETTINCSTEAGKCTIQATSGSCTCAGDDMGISWASTNPEGETPPPPTMEDCLNQVAINCGTSAPVTCKSETGYCKMSSRSIDCYCVLGDSSSTSSDSTEPVDTGNSQKIPSEETSPLYFYEDIEVSEEACLAELKDECGEKLPDLKEFCGEYLNRCANHIFVISNACAEEIDETPLSAEEKNKLENGEWIERFARQIGSCCNQYLHPEDYEDGGSSEPGYPGEDGETSDPGYPADNETPKSFISYDETTESTNFYERFVKCLEENNNQCSACIDEPDSESVSNEGSDYNDKGENTSKPSDNEEKASADNKETTPEPKKSSKSSGCSVVII